jgi:hypothetical protein
MKDYPYSITKKCPKCGRVFTCKGTGWKTSLTFGTTGRCPFENGNCYCEQCHHGKTRNEGCEEIKMEYNPSRREHE